MKRILSCLMALVLALSFAPVAYAQDAGSLSIASAQLGSSSIADEREGEFYDSLLMFDEGVHPTSGTWSDSWFASDSSRYNHDLATTAAILATAAYNGTDSDGNPVLDTSQFAIDKDFDVLGFTNKVYRNYQSEGKDSVAVSFASRTASFGNDSFPIVIASIRGTANDGEWLSNINVNDEGKDAADFHAGFDSAADEVVDYLNQYLEENGVRTAKTRVLVTGHSRGAAVANLVGYKLDNGAIADIRKNNVFAYTFAAPNVSTKADVASSSYNNIFNIVSPDIVANIPLAGWNFGKYGTTLSFPSKSNCSDYPRYWAEMQNYYAHYVEDGVNAPYTTGASRSRALVATLLAASPNVWCYYNLQHASTMTTAPGVPYYSASLHEVTESIWTKGAAATLSKAVTCPAYLNIISTAFSEENREITNWGKGGIGSMGWINIGIVDDHRPATYVAWMQSGSGADLFKNSYYSLSVTGSVDVNVYDESNKLVASIVGGKVDESLLETGLAAFLDGDARCVDIPKDANYRVVTTATGPGGMDVAWEEFDADGKTAAQTCYNDLSLTEGQSYGIDLSSKGGSGTSETIDVTNPDGSTESASYTTGSGEAGSLSVEVTAAGHGEALGASGATRGDHVTVKASPYWGESFKGWYEDGMKVSSERDYMFRLEESRSLTAVFSGSDVPSRVMHRLYNHWTGEHFYTASEEERDHLVDEGWTYEGVGWIAPEKSATPVYRLFNEFAEGGDHHYTMSVEERDSLVEAGWHDEGVGWYSDDDEGEALYREYNTNELAHNHNYTRDKAEHDNLVSLGWNDEGLAWYGVHGTEPPGVSR